MSGVESAEYPVRCDRCESWWPSSEAMMQHKKEMKQADQGHLFCEMCEQNFYNKETLMKHIAKIHPTENKLPCPGCGDNFTLVSGLMGHIGSNHCRVIRAGTLEANRVRKLKFAEDLKNTGTTARLNLSKYLAPIASEGGSSNSQKDDGRAPGRPFVDYGVANPVFFSPRIFTELTNARTAMATDNTLPASVTTNVVTSVEDSAANSEAGGVADSEAGGVADSVTDDAANSAASSLLHPTDSDSGPQQQAVKPDAWATGIALAKMLFPNAPPSANLVPAKTESPVSVSDVHSKHNHHPQVTSSNRDPTNPNSPGFNVNTCYNELLQKFKCPHVMCGKSFPSNIGLLKHLGSLAHNSTGPRLQCPHCLRYFDSAYALTQHSESQGKRCRIRETENFRMYMDQLTGGVADVDGHHAEGTVRYKVSDDAAAKFTGTGAVETLKEGMRAMARVREAVDNERARRVCENREAYWKDKKLYW